MRGCGDDCPPGCSPGKTQPTLSEKERVYIAEIEHRGLTLSKKRFPLIKDALHKESIEGLVALLAPDFKARLFDLARVEPYTTEAVRIHRADETSNGGYLSLSGRDLAEDLDGDGLTDLIRSDLPGLHIFKLRSDGRFEDIGAVSGLPVTMTSTACIALADFDGDGRVDALVEHRVFRNAGGGKFEEVTATAGFGPGNRKYVKGYAVADFDRDGLLYVYVSRSWGPDNRYGENS